MRPFSAVTVHLARPALASCSCSCSCSCSYSCPSPCPCPWWAVAVSPLPARRPLPRVKSADTRRNGNARWNPHASCTPHDRRELISSSHGSAAAHSPRVRQRRRDDHERGEGRTEPVRASSPRISCAPGSRLPRAHSDKIQIHTVSITHHALASCTYAIMHHRGGPTWHDMT